MMNKVKMELTDKDMENVQLIADQLKTKNRADAISFALTFIRTMIDKTSEAETHLLIKDEKTNLSLRVQIIPD